MREKKRGKTGIWALLAALAVGLMLACLAGCGGKDGGYRILVDDFAEITLAQDGDSAAYDRALGAVGAYLENPGEETLQYALSEVTEVREQMEADGANLKPYELREELVPVLESYGLDREEYVINADMRASYLSGYVESLKNLEFYLELAEIMGPENPSSTLEFLYGFRSEYQSYTRDFCYYGINYWFADWEGEELAYVQEQVLDHLKSFGTDGAVWENSREGAERKLNLCLGQMEECQRGFEEYLGEIQRELYEMEAEQP